MKADQKNESPYLRVGTFIYKKVRMPLSSGRNVETLIAWNTETLRQDYGKDFIAQLPKYDGFCTVPSHTDYSREILGFLNRYEPVPSEPTEGEFPHIAAFLEHIFGDNVTFNTNEDFRSQFNADWTGKLLICVDEVLLNRREDSERIKNLSTARSYKSEAKGRDRREVEFFGKFVLCSNNESNPVLIDSGETRYWVRKIPPLIHDDQSMLEKMRAEIPGLLFFLLHREMSTREESRMWFSPQLLVTDALLKIVHYNRSKPEAEMLSIIHDIMTGENFDRYCFDVTDMVNMLDVRGIRVDHTTVRRILTDSWRLSPASPTYYARYIVTADGQIEQPGSKTARIYSITKGKLDELLNDIAL